MSTPSDAVARASIDQVPPQTLEELAALGDEIAALIRAGVPLEAGLQATARDLPPRLGRLVERLAERLGRGETLSAALAAERPDYPPVMMAVVEAGLRSGRTAQAVEGMAETAHRLVDLRRSMTAAIVYPLTVALLAYALLNLYVINVGPKLAAALVDFEVPGAEALQRFVDQAAAWQRWWWVPPLALAIAALIAWFALGRATSLEGGWLRRLFGWLPGVRAMFRSWDAARMTSLLALLVEQEVPWPDALRLSGAASGSAKLRRAGEEAAASAETGQPSAAHVASSLGLPPLARWALATGSQRQLPLILRETADAYRRQALADVELARSVWPIVALVALGGTATLVYALLLFGPFTQLLRTLTEIGT